MIVRMKTNNCYGDIKINNTDNGAGSLFNNYKFGNYDNNQTIHS